MPRLMYFFPCESVFLNPLDETKWVISSILDEIIPIGEGKVRYRSGGDEKTKEGTLYLTYPWLVYSMWHREESDGDQPFEVRAIIKAPDGVETPISLPVVIQIRSQKHRVLLQAALAGFRLYGEHEITLQIRPQSEEEQEWQSKGTFPFKVVSSIQVEQDIPQP